MSKLDDAFLVRFKTYRVQINEVLLYSVAVAPPIFSKLFDGQVSFQFATGES